MSIHKWIPSVGLEIHAQIVSRHKLFSNGLADTIGSKPNFSVDLFDVALPGTLPVLNHSCVGAGVLTALAIGARVNLTSYFDRKHYFYPDLPSGYQITQKRVPLAVGGSVSVPVLDRPSFLSVRFKQLQLEQDSGKITYGEQTENGGRETLVDYNRAGVALMELVTEPDMANGKEAAAFVKEIRQLMRALGTCNGNMQDGSLRVDANVSVRLPDSAHMGTRTEIKNINGIKGLAKAIDYEIDRHIKVLESGGAIEQETRSFIEKKCITIATRGKTEQQDYCFMAEHDLPPIVLCSDHTPFPETKPTSDIINIDRLLESMPELPSQTRNRFLQDYGLSTEQIEVIMGRDDAPSFFEEVYNHCALTTAQSPVPPDLICAWITSHLYRLLDDGNFDLKDCSLKPEQLASLLIEIHTGGVSGEQGRKILRLMFDGDDRPAKTIAEDMVVVREDSLKSVCIDVLESHPVQVAKYQSGQTKLLGFLVGQVMRKISRNGDPKEVKTILIDEIKKL